MVPTFVFRGTGGLNPACRYIRLAQRLVCKMLYIQSRGRMCAMEFQSRAAACVEQDICTAAELLVCKILYVQSRAAAYVEQNISTAAAIYHTSIYTSPADIGVLY